MKSFKKIYFQTVFRFLEAIPAVCSKLLREALFCKPAKELPLVALSCHQKIALPTKGFPRPSGLKTHIVRICNGNNTQFCFGNF